MNDKPKVQLSGNDGNAYYVIGSCAKAAKKAGWPEEKWETVKAEMKSGDYDNLLRVAQTHFDVR